MATELRDLGGAGLGGRASEDGAARRDAEVRGFLAHGFLFVLLNLLMLVMDLFDGEGIWFYWVLFGWGFGLWSHARKTFDPDGRRTGGWLHSSLVSLHAAPHVAPQAMASGSQTRAAVPEPVPAGGAATAAVRRGVAEVGRLRAEAGRIGDPLVRERVLALWATADRILAVMAEDRVAADVVEAFLARYLAPAATIVGRYVRLSTRGVTMAEPALARVERHDLPLLAERFRALYESLHRGDLIDLEVASEMLEFEFGGADEPGR